MGLIDKQRRWGYAALRGEQKAWAPQGLAARRWPRCCAVEKVATKTPTADPTPGGMNGFVAGDSPIRASDWLSYKTILGTILRKIAQRIAFWLLGSPIDVL